MGSVRAITKSDIGGLSKVLGRAFYDDPVMNWMLPGDAARAKGLPRLFGAITRYQYFATGGCEIALADDGSIGGAALWAPPDTWKGSQLSELRMMPAMILAFGRRVQVGQEVAETMKKNHPQEPHWYLSTIGHGPRRARRRARLRVDEVASRPGRRRARARLSRIEQARKRSVLREIRFRDDGRDRHSGRWADSVCNVAESPLSAV